MRTVLALTLLASCTAAQADIVDILSTNRSIDGYVHLYWGDAFDTDTQSFGTTEAGPFNASIDIAAEPINPFFIAAQAAQASMVSPLDIWGQTTAAFQYDVSSGLATGVLRLSAYLFVEFQVNQAVPYDFTGAVAEPATVWVSGPGVSFGVSSGTNSESGVLDPGVYTLFAEWAIEYDFDSGSGAGQAAWTPWDFTLQLPAPMSLALLAPAMLAPVRRPRRPSANR
jgi:hypothetical protein